MLVLKRRKGQEIVINGQIRILVIQTGEGSCSLAFEAPDSCRIRRGELPAFDRTFADPICHTAAAELQVH
ncbi:MAG UNVERIFIED_CONTAM: carbon storage regulator [Planctomycetaceae bacterium]|jgi:carbon storage regulator CsrA